MINKIFTKKASDRLFFKRTHILGILTVLLFMLSGCFLIPKEEEVLAPILKEPPQVVYDLVEIKKQGFEKKVLVTGYFVSVTQKDLSFISQSGRLKSLQVKYGDKVKKGTLLSELVNYDLVNQIKLQELNLDKIQMEYTTMIHSLEKQIKLQELNLSKIQLQYSSSVHSLERQIKQQESNIEKVQLSYDIAVGSEDSEYNIKQAELAISNEKNKLTDIMNDLTDLKSNKSQAYFDVMIEKLKLENLKSDLLDKKSNKSQAYLNIVSENLKLDNLNTELSQLRLYSPIDGTVVYTTTAKEGSIIDAYSTVVTVADIADLQVEYYDEKVGEFSLGMKVDLKYGEENMIGTVVMTPSNVPIDAADKTKKSIRIKISNLPKDINLGDSVDISLMQIKKENVIVIDKNAIHNVGLRKFVNILENGLKKERDIETGDENTTETIVLNGLSEGDQLIKS